MTVTAATSSLAVTSSADSASTAKTGSDEVQDRFLKLLVAQLNNQDPMNPMDNAQMTTQIAQINTVTGISQLNDTMKAMAAQATATQMLSAGNMIGRSVLTEGNTLAVDSGSAIGAIELDGKATDVKVQVMTAGGTLIDTVSLGALDAGQHGFSLDAANYPTSQALQFKVVATNGKDTVATTSLMRDKVVAVGSDSAGVTLTLLSAGVKSYSAVHAIL